MARIEPPRGLMIDREYRVLPNGTASTRGHDIELTDAGHASFPRPILSAINAPTIRSRQKLNQHKGDQILEHWEALDDL